jgi:toxin HigB-1
LAGNRVPEIYNMTVQFKNAYLEKLFEGEAVSGKPRYSDEVIVKFKKTILKLKMVNDISEIKDQKGLNFEGLKGNWKGFYSARVDDSYRLILTVDKNEAFPIAEVLTLHELINYYQ